MNEKDLIRGMVIAYEEVKGLVNSPVREEGLDPQRVISEQENAEAT